MMNSFLSPLKKRAKDAIAKLATKAQLESLSEQVQLIHHYQGASAAAKTGQLNLMATWKLLASQNKILPSFGDVEFRAFSQNGEDGILLYIFSLIGWHNKILVEICAGDGIQCNSTNLILNHGCTGLLVDGNEQLLQRGREFYHRHPDTFSFPPQLVQAWIDKETVNETIEGAGIKGAIDLLSIDLDGVDYWIWDAINIIHPRVVVVEIQCIWGSDKSLSVPYSHDFHSPLVEGYGIYSGASLRAFDKLAKRKGYRLVGVQELGFNAFFVRNDIASNFLPEVSVEACLDRPFVHWARENFLPLVKDMPWVEV